MGHTAPPSLSHTHTNYSSNLPLVSSPWNRRTLASSSSRRHPPQTPGLQRLVHLRVQVLRRKNKRTRRVHTFTPQQRQSTNGSKEKAASLSGNIFGSIKFLWPSIDCTNGWMPPVQNSYLSCWSCQEILTRKERDYACGERCEDDGNPQTDRRHTSYVGQVVVPWYRTCFGPCWRVACGMDSPATAVRAHMSP